MTGNAVSGHVRTARNAEEISAEISGALNELKKSGYVVTFLENEEDGELVIIVALGEAQQTLKVDRDGWKKPGAIAKIIIDKLTI